MKLAIMTKSTFFVEEDKILSSLFDEGMDNLHLFKPGSSPMYAERLLTLLPEDYLRKITVHDHYYHSATPVPFRSFRPYAERDEEEIKLCVSEKHLRLY